MKPPRVDKAGTDTSRQRVQSRGPRLKRMTTLAHHPGVELPETARRQWWETRTFVIAMMLISIVPLLYPQPAPLVDLLGHIGRYRVQIDESSSAFLQRYYAFHWAPIGNLGVDLLVQLLGPVIGLEPAVKLIVISIPALTTAGFLFVAREVHHRLPPTAIFSLLFVYNHPFIFGFVNFSFSMALAFIAFGLWLRLGRQGRLKLRAALFVPISIVMYFTHTFGWGTLGLLAFSAEAVRQHDSGQGWFRSGVNAALHASVMALPLVLVFAWRSETTGALTRNFFEWKLKWEWIYSAVRDRWQWFDIGTVAIIPLLFLYTVFSRRLTISRNLAFSVLILTACFILLPWTMFGSAYADMRLAPYMFALVPLSMRFSGETHLPTARTIAILGVTLFTIRIAGVTASMFIAAQDQEAKLEALDHVPMGARVVTLVGRECGREWPLPRLSHIPGLIIDRREGFSNDQWQISGVNLLHIRYSQAGIFRQDPSQMVSPDWCGKRRWTVDKALPLIPPGAFDYLWLVDVPPYNPDLTRGMTLVWKGPRTMLYRLPQ